MAGTPNNQAAAHFKHSPALLGERGFPGAGNFVISCHVLAF